MGGVSRRSILRGGMVGAAAVVGGLSGAQPSAASAASVDLSGLVATLSPEASLFRPGEASYEALAAPVNHQFANVRPTAILAPSSVSDVQAAIRWAKANGVRVTPRSGAGHNYAGYSNSSGLLMVMSRFRDIAVSPNVGGGTPQSFGPVTVVRNAGTVTVGAGVVNADLHPLLEESGYLVPTGRCSTVGVAGLVLGGGIGFSDKMAGLTCDRLLSTTVVLADGRTVIASPASEPELFWACRGGAGNNFGIHTDFTFSFDLIQGPVTFYSLSWSLDSAVIALRAMQTVCSATQSDRRFHARLGMSTSGATPAIVQQRARATAIGQFYGTPAELTSLLSEALTIGSPAEQQRNRASIRQMTAAETSVALSEAPGPGQFTGASAILDKPMSDGQLQKLADAVRAWPGSRSDDGVDFALFALGGAVNEKSSSDTSFVHRSSLFVAQFNVNWDDADPQGSPAKHRSWLSSAYVDVFGGTPSRMYQNFPDPYIANAQTAYYGSNYSRLQSVKRTYDPGQFFWYPQAIAP